MNVVDANVLIYGVDSTSPPHAAARRWLEGALSGAEAVGFAWTALLAFVRVSTNASIFRRPLRLPEAVAEIESWLAQPAAVVLHPTPRHLGVLAGLLGPLGSAANLVNDAHLAALAIEHGGGVVTFDADFRRFPGLRVVTPG